jgi:hypothetical protein
MALYKFVCEMHKEHGALGWRQKSQPDFDPLGGMAVAHDILEHLPNGSEAPHDEFMALGAAVLIRGMQGYFMNNTPADNLCSDFPDIFSHIVYQDIGLCDAPVTNRLQDEWAETMISETVNKGRALMISEWNMSPKFNNEEPGMSIHELDVYLHHVKGWMRIGFRKARKRYNGRVRDFEFTYLFKEIEKEADKALKNAEEQDELHVRLVRNRVDVKHLSAYELYPRED